MMPNRFLPFALDQSRGDAMETINDVIIIRPHPDGPTVELGHEPTVLGPELTAGAYLAMLGVMPPDDVGPPLHLHPHTDELFYIAEGEVTFHLGDQDVVAGPGTCVFVPRGTVHTARVTSTTPMRGMLLLSPGTAEHVFEPVPDGPGTTP
jgi:mannose-6-phosphate isomerase-like protein (cupin superfamily)